MINCRERPGKFKKKIAELLNQVFKENDEFDAKYAPLVRKKVQFLPREAQPSTPAVKTEVEVFGEDSREFKEALRKLSPDILQIIRDQFKCEPSALIRGAFKDEDKSEPQKGAEPENQNFDEVQDLDEAQDFGDDSD